MSEKKDNSLENENQKDTNTTKEDKVKVVVSSLKVENNKEENQKITLKDNNEIKKEKEENKNTNNTDTKFNFFKTFYYSTIRIDKINLLIESSKGWLLYIFVLILLLSVAMGFSVGHLMTMKTEEIKNQINELPEFVYKNGKIIGDIDISFLDEETGSLVIVNTIDSVFDIRNKYKSDIDKVDQYILLTKDTIYAEPGDSFEYSEFNFLEEKAINKEETIEFLNILLGYKFITVISGFLASMVILLFVAFFSFFAGRFVITIFSIYGIKSYNFKHINKMAMFLTSMPFLIFVILTILNQLKILTIKVNIVIVYSIIYLFYIVIASQIIKRKQNNITIVKNASDLKKIIDDTSSESMDEIEAKEKKKREQRKKLKEKEKKKTKENKNQEDEIIEGA